MIYRVLYRSLFALGLVMFGLAGYLDWIEREPPAMTIDEPEREFADTIAGQTVPLSFALHNPWWKPGRVVGLASC